MIRLIELRHVSIFSCTLLSKHILAIAASVYAHRYKIWMLFLEPAFPNLSSAQNLLKHSAIHEVY